MKVAVASDHAAVPLRRAVLEWIAELGHEPIDFGTDREEPVDYPDVIAPAAHRSCRQHWRWSSRSASPPPL